MHHNTRQPLLRWIAASAPEVGEGGRGTSVLRNHHRIEARSLHAQLGRWAGHLGGEELGDAAVGHAALEDEEGVALAEHACGMDTVIIVNNQ